MTFLDYWKNIKIYISKKGLHFPFEVVKDQVIDKRMNGSQSFEFDFVKHPFQINTDPLPPPPPPCFQAHVVHCCYPYFQINEVGIDLKLYHASFV